MRNRLTLVLLFGFLILFASCKDEKKLSEEATTTNKDTSGPQIVIKGDQPRALTEAEKKKHQSIMSKLMVTKECSTFSSYLVTVGLTDKLFSEEGPFTIFAPSNEAFEALNGELNLNLSKTDKLTAVTTMIKSHIVAGDHNSVSLNQSLKSGSVTLTSLSGSTFRISKSGSDLIVKDEKGAKATIGKSDITGGNGVLHVIDAVLARN